MEVIAHHGETGDFDAEEARKFDESVLDPSFAMVVCDAREGIVTAQEGASHDTLNAMIKADFARVDRVPPILPCHGRPPGCLARG
jgi:hypothetical protein